MGTSRKFSETELQLSSRFFLCLQYALASVCLTLSNRALFLYYEFNFPGISTLLQLLISILFILLFGYWELLPIDTLSLHSASQIAPLAFFWWLYVVSGVVALRYLTLPMYNSVRRLTPVALLIIEKLWFSGTATSAIQNLSLLLICCSAALTVYGDVNLNRTGLIWITVCILSTAVYLILIKHYGKSLRLNNSTMLLYNNILGVPLMIISLYVLGAEEIVQIRLYPYISDHGFQLFLIFTSSQAFLLNYSIFRCTQLNSPMATSITGQMKDFVTIGVAMFIMHDSVPNVYYHIGVIFGLLGGCLYAYGSYSSLKHVK